MKGNTFTFKSLAFAGAVGILASAGLRADIINFDSNPNLPEGPSLFSEAGVAQNIAVDGLTFSGGVILGDATNLTSEFVTQPNVYATSDPSSGADASLQEVINLVINPSVDATSVEGVLFNGENVPVTYTIEGFVGNTLVDSQVFTDLASNADAGSANFTVTSQGQGLTSITFTPTLIDDTKWDYVIDTIAVNESIQDAVVPEPQTYAEIIFGLALLAWWNRRRTVRSQGAAA